MAVHRSQPKKKGPAVSVPGTKKAAPLTGRSSFAKRVKTRRRKAETAATTRPKTGSNTAPKPKKQPTLLSREERLAIAAGRTPPPSSGGNVATQPASAVTTTVRSPKQALTPPTAPEPRPARPKEQRDPNEGFVAVGRVLGPFGLKGEMKVLSLTDNPDRFAPKSRLHAGQQLVTLAASREAGQHLYLMFKGFSDRTSVEKFRGALLQIPESELPELEEGEYYRFQLVGLEVVDKAGAKLGTVAEVIETGATDVYRITAPGTSDLLLAAAPDVIVEIDIKAKRIVVDPPAWT